MKKYNLISKEEVKSILRINTDRTIYSYIKAGIIQPVKDEDHLGTENMFDRGAIYRILGLKPNHTEPLLTPQEAAEVVGLENWKYLNSFSKSRGIPQYKLINAKGSFTYYLKSELLAAIKWRVEFLKDFSDFVGTNYFIVQILSKVFTPTMIKGLKEQEITVLKSLIVERKSLSQTAKEMKVGRERARQVFMIACKRVYHKVAGLENRLNIIESLEAENIKLREENKVMFVRLSSGSFEAQREAHPINKILLNMNFSARAKKVFSILDIRYLGELSLIKKSFIEKFQGVGQLTIDEMDKALTDNGLAWAREVEPRQEEQKHELT